MIIYDSRAIWQMNTMSWLMVKWADSLGETWLLVERVNTLTEWVNDKF